MPLELAPLGDSALILRVGDSLGEVLNATRHLEAAQISGVIDIAPAFASVGIFFASPDDLAKSADRVQAIVREGNPSLQGDDVESRAIEVPVCYEPDYGLDLNEVSQHSRLSPNDIARCHASADYQVRCVGFTPGFPYLSGLPEALTMPRRATPRVAVPAGSVAIGGAQTGIYPLASPGGWNIIGRTPLRIFDVKRMPAALLQTGDRVRFVAITATEFARWEK